ncbi:MAG: winged helix-turn-helix transcriptional regulator [Lachnospiraceae bacterium]|nr:winged helix-turn-helix transcriptional regulator [Lachnospiraceae bacterium]
MNDPINELTEDENRILEIIKSSRKPAREEMAQEIGKSKAAAQRCIKSLLDQGFIKCVGSNKTGYWAAL